MLVYNMYDLNAEEEIIRLFCRDRSLCESNFKRDTADQHRRKMLEENKSVSPFRLSVCFHP